MTALACAPYVEQPALLDLQLVRSPRRGDGLPLYPTGVRAWCPRCERLGRRRLAEPRGGGLVACGRCLAAHEAAWLVPSDESPHDDELCLVCRPVDPDIGDELVAQAVLERQGAQLLADAAAAAARVSLRERVDDLVAVRAQARRTEARWARVQQRALDVAGEGDAVRGAGRGVLLTAAALAMWEPTRTSSRGRTSHLPMVAAVMVADGERASGRRARPGRADTAALCGISEQAVTGHWAALERSGWCERTVQGGAVPLRVRLAEKRSQDRAEWDLLPLPHQVVDPDTRPDLIEWAARLLAQVAERAGVLADLARQEADAAGRELEALDPRQARAARVRRMVDAWRTSRPGPTPAADAAVHSGNFLPPPGGGSSEKSSSGYTGFELSRARTRIARYVPSTVRPGGRARPASKSQGPRSPRVWRPRTVKPQCPRALELAHELRDHPALPQLRKAPVPMLTSTVKRFADAGWTAADVVAHIRQAIAAQAAARPGWTVTVTPARPVKWFRELLDGADLAVPPAQAAAAAKAAAAQRRRDEIAQAQAAADARAATVASDEHRAASAAAARAALLANARAAGRTVRPARQPQARTVLPAVPPRGVDRAAAALAALDEALDELGWPKVAQPGAGLRGAAAGRPATAPGDEHPTSA